MVVKIMIMIPWGQVKYWIMLGWLYHIHWHFLFQSLFICCNCQSLLRYITVNSLELFNASLFVLHWRMVCCYCVRLICFKTFKSCNFWSSSWNSGALGCCRKSFLGSVLISSHTRHIQWCRLRVLGGYFVFTFLLI